MNCFKEFHMNLPALQNVSVCPVRIVLRLSILILYEGYNPHAVQDDRFTFPEFHDDRGVNYNLSDCQHLFPHQQTLYESCEAANEVRISRKVQENLQEVNLHNTTMFDVPLYSDDVPMIMANTVRRGHVVKCTISPEVKFRSDAIHITVAHQDPGALFPIEQTFAVSYPHTPREHLPPSELRVLMGESSSS
jgi:hypothetical protein